MMTMYKLIFVAFFILLKQAVESLTENTSLRMVTALFRHGDRTRDVYVYPKDPYINETFEPYGIGELTLEGKFKQYNLGVMLRKRYDKFLGPLYRPQDVYAVTTNFSRTKCSLQLVLVGLYPTKNTELQWHTTLNWNPIAYDVLYFNTNRFISDPYTYCPRYKKELDDFFESDQAKHILSKYVSQHSYLSNHTGLNPISILDLYVLYDILKTEIDWGLTLPMWTKLVYPEYLKNASIDNLFVFNANHRLTRLNGGFLLKKIINDMFAVIEGKGPKINLYSAHDGTVATLLSAMNVFFHHMPPYSACVIIELHNINDDYFVEVFYQDYTSGNNIKHLVIPRCEAKCPINKFVDALKMNIPDDDGDPCALD